MNYLQIDNKQSVTIHPNKQCNLQLTHQYIQNTHQNHGIKALNHGFPNLNKPNNYQSNKYNHQHHNLYDFVIKYFINIFIKVFKFQFTSVYYYVDKKHYQQCFQCQSQTGQVNLCYQYQKGVCCVVEKDQGTDIQKGQLLSDMLDAVQFTQIIYFSARSPQIITNDKTCTIQKNYSAFNLTFLQNLDAIGNDFSWNSRKSITLSYYEIFALQKLKLGQQKVIKNIYQPQQGSTTSATEKTLIIRACENNLISFKFIIYSQKQGDKWQNTYQLKQSDFIMLIQSAKKQIYSLSGMKIMIDMQKRDIIRQMDARYFKDQQIVLKPKNGLLDLGNTQQYQDLIGYNNQSNKQHQTYRQTDAQKQKLQQILRANNIIQ